MSSVEEEKNNNEITGGFGGLSSVFSPKINLPATSEDAAAKAAAKAADKAAKDAADKAAKDAAAAKAAVDATARKGFLGRQYDTLTGRMPPEKLKEHATVIGDYTNTGTLLISAHLKQNDKQQVEVVLESFLNADKKKLLNITAEGLIPAGENSDINQTKSIPLQTLLGEKQGIKIVTSTGEPTAPPGGADGAVAAPGANGVTDTSSEPTQPSVTPYDTSKPVLQKGVAGFNAPLPGQEFVGGRTRRRRRRNKKMSSRRRRASRRR